MAGVVGTENWETEVRAIADASNEGKREFTSGEVKARYYIAKVLNGWAWRASFDQHNGYFGTPWSRTKPSREKALEEALDCLRRQINHGTDRGKEIPDLNKVKALLADDGMFGFIEPEPAKEEPRKEIEFSREM